MGFYKCRIPLFIKKTKMNSTNLFKKETVKLFFIVICFSCLYSCSKENKNEPQSTKTETPKTENSNKSANLSNDFIVSYNLEGKLAGKMEIYRSGDMLRQNMNTEIMGMQTDNVIYILDKTVYSIINVAGKTIGTKTDLSNYNASKETGETITDFKEFEKFLDSKKVTGTENILGYNCDVYDISKDVKLSVYNKRYILKIQAQEFMAVATALNTSPSFSKEEFEVPKDVDFKTTDMKELSKPNIDSLVNKFK